MSINQKLQHFLQIAASGALTLYVIYLSQGIPGIWLSETWTDGTSESLRLIFAAVVTGGVIVMLWWAASSLLSAVRSLRRKDALSAKYPVLELYLLPVLWVILITTITFFLPPLSGL